tara:strand:- start:40 stop:261 length:222 start_codon:yes stop_codon:yes gene_type:complete
MTQLVFDESWVEPASMNNCWFSGERKPYNKGNIRWPWMDRYEDAFNKWWDSGRPEGEEPLIDDFIPRMTEETN